MQEKSNKNKMNMKAKKILKSSLLFLSIAVSSNAMSAWPNDNPTALNMTIQAILVGDGSAQIHFTTPLLTSTGASALPSCSNSYYSKLVSIDLKAKPDMKYVLTALQTAHLANRKVDVYVSASCIWGAEPTPGYVVIK